MKRIAIKAALLISLIALAAPAYAQFFSAGGITNTSPTSSCRSGALALQQRALVLQKDINLILSCNSNGQLFDSSSGGCVDPTPTLSPDHTFNFLASGDTLSLENPDGTAGNAARVGGRDGSSIVCRPIPVGCTAPWGQAVPDGFGVTAYQTGSVPAGERCVSERRNCNNGNLNGSFSNENCRVSPPVPPTDCTSPWGTIVFNEGSITAYQNSSVPFEETCSNETRTCNNGTLSGSYTFSSCTPSAPDACALPWGGNIANGQRVTAYQNTSVPFGQTCNSQARACNNGTLSGSYTFDSCTPSAPDACALPWGGNIAHGANVTAYQTASVPYGSTCASQSRSCNDGTLSGSYTNQSCSAMGATSCTLPWGGNIAHGDSITAYEADSVASNQTCNDQTRICDDGALSGSFTHRNCTVREPVTICSPWQWDFDGWCQGRPQCNNFNIFDKACHGDPNCTLRNVNYVMNTCAVCNVEGERCITQ